MCTGVIVCVNVNFFLDCVSLRVYMRTGVNVCVNVNFVLDCISLCMSRTSIHVSVFVLM